MTDQQPPNDHGAEQAVLGSMLLDHAAALRGTELLTVEDFYRPAHGAVFRAITEAILAREPTDALAIGTRLGNDLTRIGGGAYLHDLIAAVDVPSSIGWHARIVAERARMRRLIEAGQRIIQLGQDLDRDPADAMALATKYLAAAGDTKMRTDPVAWADLVNPAIKAMEEAHDAGRGPGLSTGLKMLDTMTGGLRGGQLVVLAGRPGMGKSIFAVDLARQAAFTQNRPAVIFSLEMSRNEIFGRVMAAESGTSLTRITRGGLNDDDWTTIARRSGETEAAPLFIDDSAPIALTDIVAKSRRLHARTPLGLVVVDYLQLLTTGGRTDSREREVSDISRALKLLAKELDCPVVAAAQLNRQVEQRADKHPVLSDLRESGSVEQDADIVIMLYREDYYNESARQRELELMVLKHRGGPSGTVIAVTDFAHGRILDPDA